MLLIKLTLVLQINQAYKPLKKLPQGQKDLASSLSHDLSCFVCKLFFCKPYYIIALYVRVIFCKPYYIITYFYEKIVLSSAWWNIDEILELIYVIEQKRKKGPMPSEKMYQKNHIYSRYICITQHYHIICLYSCMLYNCTLTCRTMRRS